MYRVTVDIHEFDAKIETLYYVGMADIVAE